MSRVPIVHHPAYQAPMPAGHRFPMGKFGRLVEVLIEEGIVARNGLHEPELASAEMLSLAHDPAYVAAVFELALEPAAERRIGLPITEEVVRRSRAACGGTLLAARLALARGLACNTAGGSHHAGPAGGAGFCVFNDVAAAALQLLAEDAIARALVIDLDVHQGDGTADIFAGDPRVFTLSVHCEANFPTRKAQSDLDVGLPRGLGDDAYLDALAPALEEAMVSARPDLIFYNAGVDPHTDDQLGHLALSDEGLARRDRMVFARARAAAVPVAGVLGGGYGPDIDAIARRHAILHRTAAGFIV
jgi:acetoin utilization deacetylase AcuC-like enzyme